jgi:hypothetical protein
VEGRHISAVGKFVGEGFIKFDEVFVWPKEMLEDGRSLSKWIDTFESSYGYESDTHFYKDKHGNIIHNVARSPTVGPATASGDPVCLMPAVHQLKMKIQAAYKDEQTLVASKKGAHDGLVQWIGVRTLRRRMGDGIADEFSFPLKPVGVNRNDVFDWCTKFWSTIKEEKAKSKTSMKAPARRHELARLVDKYSWDALGAQKPQKRKKGCSRWPQGLLQVASRTKADINYVDGVDPDEDTTAGIILRLNKYCRPLRNPIGETSTVADFRVRPLFFIACLLSFLSDFCVAEIFKVHALACAVCSSQPAQRSRQAPAASRRRPERCPLRIASGAQQPRSQHRCPHSRRRGRTPAARAAVVAQRRQRRWHFPTMRSPASAARSTACRWLRCWWMPSTAITRTSS